MEKRFKRTFTQDEYEQCWALWRQGLGYSDIGRIIDAKPGTVFGLVRVHALKPRKPRGQCT